MIRSPNYMVSLVLGSLILATSASTSAFSAGEISGTSVQPISDRCSRLGGGLVDVGNGMCGRVTSGHLRVDLGARNAAMNAWSGGGSANNAAMRSYEPTMVPGAQRTQHLRVRGLDTFSPFR